MLPLFRGMEEKWFLHSTVFYPGIATEIECSSSALLYIAEKVTASGVYLQAPWAEQKNATWILPFQLSVSKITLPLWGS